MADWSAVEAAVYAAARPLLGDAQLATGPLVAAIKDRSVRYTSDRDRLASPASPKADLAARAVFFTIADAPKVAVPIRELIARGALPATRPLRVVDLGAGCGAMSLGLLATLPSDVPIAIAAIDRDRDALAIAHRAVTQLATNRAPTTISTSTADATTAKLPAADLVLIGTMLNELAPPARLAVIERALATISDDGAVIIVEPALRDTTRALHELRDAILTSAHVFAPCTRRGTPCPALADPTDWCHEHRSVKLPPRTAELARITHLRDDGLKFSYLVLRKQAAPTLSDDPSAWRIVGAPWAQKGKLEVLACSDAAFTKLRLLKRNRAPGNRALEDVKRGDVVSVGAAPDNDRVEIASDTSVTLARPGE